MTALGADVGQAIRLGQVGARVTRRRGRQQDKLSPIDEKVESDLITTWNLVPDPQAFHGVASGGHIFCRYEDLGESYSGTSDSYGAVGIKDGKMVVYFYNG